MNPWNSRIHFDFSEWIHLEFMKAFILTSHKKEFQTNSGLGFFRINFLFFLNLWKEGIHFDFQKGIILRMNTFRIHEWNNLEFPEKGIHNEFRFGIFKIKFLFFWNPGRNSFWIPIFRFARPNDKLHQLNFADENNLKVKINSEYR